MYIDRVALEEGGDPAVYPFSLGAVRALAAAGTLKLHPKCTFLIGENGIGKSTLVEAIAVRWGFNAEGGTKNFNFGTRNSHSGLFQNLKLWRPGGKKPRDGFFLRAESFFNLATNIEALDAEGGLGNPVIDSYGGKSLHEQSHGESFFSLFLNRFGGNGFYILDEPEAALSPSRQLAFLVRLHDLIEKSSQFIIATHSPILMAYPDAWIYQLTEDGLERVEYEDTDHFQLTHRFLNNREGMLEQLLAEDDEDESGQRRFEF